MSNIVKDFNSKTVMNAFLDYGVKELMPPDKFKEWSTDNPFQGEEIPEFC